MKIKKEIAKKKQLKYIKSFENKFFFCPKCKIIFDKQHKYKHIQEESLYQCEECEVQFNHNTYKEYANNKIKLHLNGSNDTNVIDQHFKELIKKLKEHEVSNTKIYDLTQLPFHMIERIIKL